MVNYKKKKVKLITILVVTFLRLVTTEPLENLFKALNPQLAETYLMMLTASVSIYYNNYWPLWNHIVLPLHYIRNFRCFLAICWYANNEGLEDWYPPLSARSSKKVGYHTQFLANGHGFWTKAYRQIWWWWWTICPKTLASCPNFYKTVEKKQGSYDALT